MDGSALQKLMMASPVPRKDDLLGFSIRNDLYPGEQSYFQSNPNVTGMASESGHVLLNPYSSPDINRASVAKNEALRLLLSQRGVTPSFGVAPDQREFFAGTPYQNDEGSMRETIAARIYSGDPSIAPTGQQQQWLADFLKSKR